MTTLEKSVDRGLEIRAQMQELKDELDTIEECLRHAALAGEQVEPSRARWASPQRSVFNGQRSVAVRAEPSVLEKPMKLNGEALVRIYINNELNREEKYD